MGYSLVVPKDDTLHRQRHDHFVALVKAGRLKGAEIIDGLWAGICPNIDLTTAGLSDMGLSALEAYSDVLQGERLKIGGYGEIRHIYETDAFLGDGDEARQLHLGLDLFAVAQTAIRAPLSGHIHSFQDNDAPLDYGPTLILKHRLDDFEFYSLYGHLDRQSLKAYVVDKPIASGEILGHMGAPHENGGWAPHLHYQLILDRMGCSGDYPGVFRQSEGAFWQWVCPDPRPLLGLGGQV